jgi:hypothetical protein
MIYIFGDSWGFSYKTMTRVEMNMNDIPNSRVVEYFSGKNLAGWLEEMLNATVTNFCERGLNNFKVIEKMKLVKELFREGDYVYVLQTSPLRDSFIHHTHMYANTLPSKKYNLKLTTPMNIMEICDNFLLKDFYKGLSEIQEQSKIKIILHGGCSKLNIPLAESFGLTCTPKSSTEYIIPGYEDNYFFDTRCVIDDLEELSFYKNYVKDEKLELKILDDLKAKSKIWEDNPFYFSYHHPTDRGTRKVAELLFNYIDIKKYLSSLKIRRYIDLKNY